MPRGLALDPAGTSVLDAAFTAQDPAGVNGQNGWIAGQLAPAMGETGTYRLSFPNTTGDDYRVTAGHPMATSFADQINQTKAYEPEDSFSDAVKGLHLYGAKVVRPTAVATMVASGS